MGSLAVVIPAFRSERTIRRCLELFSEEAPAAELIVVDIDDRPGMRAVLDEHHPDVVVHVTPPSHAVVDD